MPETIQESTEHEFPPLPMGPGEYDQMIRERAFELYLARRAEGIEGSPEDDWARAEFELGDPVVTVGSVRVPYGVHG